MILIPALVSDVFSLFAHSALCLNFVEQTYASKVWRKKITNWWPRPSFRTREKVKIYGFIVPKTCIIKTSKWKCIPFFQLQFPGLDDHDEQNKPIIKEETRNQKQNRPQVHLHFTIQNYLIIFTFHQDFLVKYLGKRDARGIWGIKHTRRPVDDLVGLAWGLGPGAPLPYLELSVSHKGVMVTPHKNNTCNTKDCGMYPIDTISYGVQDLVYTRVFAMVIVKVNMKLGLPYCLY